MKQLAIGQIIEIFSNNKILFKASIKDVWQDTEWNEVEFEIDDERYSSFTFNLDLDVHGGNIQSHVDGWFFKVTTEEELFKVITVNREKYIDSLTD